jgi:acyl carrier protein
VNPTNTQTAEADPNVVLTEITGMLHRILGEDSPEESEITMDTQFHDDLEMESIDLVALAGELSERYGTRVNFAEFIADLDLDEIIDLRVGQLVDYVVEGLHGTHSSPREPSQAEVC